jgi:hypothetical protein
LLAAEAEPTASFGGNGCGFRETLLAAEAAPTCCFGGNGCGFRDTLLAAEAEPTCCFGGSGCGFKATLLSAEAAPFCTLAGTCWCFFSGAFLASGLWPNARVHASRAVTPTANTFFMLHPFFEFSV